MQLYCCAGADNALAIHRNRWERVRFCHKLGGSWEKVVQLGSASMNIGAISTADSVLSIFRGSSLTLSQG